MTLSDIWLVTGSASRIPLVNIEVDRVDHAMHLNGTSVRTMSYVIMHQDLEIIKVLLSVYNTVDDASS